MKRCALLASVMLATIVVSASGIAFPDGAPWGAANPANPDHSASWHWERPARANSQQLELDGLPERVRSGGVYALTVTLSDPTMQISGFQIVAEADGQPAGEFSARDERLESALIGTMLRTMTPADALAGRVRWQFEWQAPATIGSPVIVYLAASAANNDGSPFGDVIHYQQYMITP